MILHRAFVRETLHACGVVSVILLAVFVAVRGLGFLRQAVEGDIPAARVLLLLALKTITYLDIILPLALYIGALAVLGRWLRDHELTVIAACGIGAGRLLRPAALLFALIGGAAALFSLYLSPLAAEAARAIVHDARSRADIAGLLPGVFTEGRDGSVYFIERYESGEGGESRAAGNAESSVDNDASDGDAATAPGQFRNLFVYHRGGDGGGIGGETKDGVVVAERGRLVTDASGDFLVLQNGSRYVGAPGDAEHALLDFETYGLRLAPPVRDYRLPVEAQSTAALLGARHAAARGELHWRFSKVAMLAALLVFALALGFSSTAQRKNRFPGMLVALLVYFAYSNIAGLVAAQVSRGATGPMALWGVHLIFLAAALALLRRRHLGQPLLPTVRMPRLK